MITTSKQFSFKAKDFFDYLESQLIPAIKKARGNNMPVSLTKGTKYEINGGRALFGLGARQGLLNPDKLRMPDINARESDCE